MLWLMLFQVIHATKKGANHPKQLPRTLCVAHEPGWQHATSTVKKGMIYLSLELEQRCPNFFERLHHLTLYKGPEKIIYIKNLNKFTLYIFVNM